MSDETEELVPTLNGDEVEGVAHEVTVILHGAVVQATIEVGNLLLDRL